MEKAIEIKRRAQRCVQNGDVDGALREYEKLVEGPDSDPYNFVLLADLLHKKGEHGRAGERYLHAVTAYEQAGLYKNGIAVCKKMMRLSLSQGEVLRHLAELHALDGLVSEASVYFAQYAEFALRLNKSEEAIGALRKAFDHGQENVKLLERLSEVLLLEGETAKSAATMVEAAEQWQARGQAAEARRCLARAEVIQPGSGGGAVAGAPAPAPGPPQLHTPTGGVATAPPVAAPAAPPQDLGVLTGSRIPETAPTMSLPSAPPTLGVPVAAAAPAAAPAPAPPVAAAPPAPAPSLAPPVAAPPVAAPPLAAMPPAAPPAAAPVLYAPAAVPSLAPSAPVSAGPNAAAPPQMDSGVFERAPRFVAPPGASPTPAPAPAPTSESDDEPAAPAAGVYEIGGVEATSYEAALREVSAAQAARPAPAPFPAEPELKDPSPSTIANRPEQLLGVVASVEELLQRAQDEFRAGNRDRASQALVEAALAYERLGRPDSAATIFRSLGRGALAPVGVMELWLANCELRGDAAEGSQVACELGDRALNDGGVADARRWFERALAIQPGNDTARRRLQRMSGAAKPPAPAQEGPSSEQGRVAVAVGRGQAVTFDLDSLLQEFQRGVSAQLEGDAQGHYDLGMAYREMGLFDEAVGSFRIAERDPRLAMRSREMIGRCLANSDRHDDAAREFERALRSPTLDAAGEAELRFQLALSLAALGEMADALAQAEIADMRFPGRPDVADRLVEWRRAFGKAA